MLTEPVHFLGSLDDLAGVAEAVAIPVLRKDFIVDAYQVWEARAAGAAAVLLIVAALEDGVLADLHRVAAEAGLDALVEAHDELRFGARPRRYEAAGIAGGRSSASTRATSRR